MLLYDCRECYDAMTEAQRNRLEAYNRSNLQVCQSCSRGQSTQLQWTVRSQMQAWQRMHSKQQRLLQFKPRTAEGMGTMGMQNLPNPA